MENIPVSQMKKELKKNFAGISSFRELPLSMTGRGVQGFFLTEIFSRPNILMP